MPEGHSVHRIARQFRVNFVGHAPEVTSPQGRFAEGAKLLSGHTITDVKAVGKHLFLGFEHDLWLRVHLGIYGAWDFSGNLRVDPSILIHATNEHGQFVPVDRASEDSVASIGAPRVTRMRMSETEKEDSLEGFPPDPVGQVRVRLLTDTVCADLRGPTACEVQTPEEMQATVARLGPDPANDDSEAEAERFMTRAAAKSTPIGLVLMDQAVIAGIGNVYRAEMLFRAELDPHTPARQVHPKALRQLWDDWKYLLDVGIRVGQMMTIDGLADEDYRRALENLEDRHWVYKREGETCRRCGATVVLEEFGGRKLYWCPGCQKPRRRRGPIPKRKASV